MQGREENILTSTDKLVTFKKKVAIWKNRAEDCKFEMFPLVRKSCKREMSTLENSGRIQLLFSITEDHKYDQLRNPFIEILSHTRRSSCEEE